MNSKRFAPSYRVVQVAYQFGHESRYDPAIRIGTAIVWHEAREGDKLYSHAGSATARAKRILADVSRWLQDA
jgi:hypothetical protein